MDQDLLRKIKTLLIDKKIRTDNRIICQHHTRKLFPF